MDANTEKPPRWLAVDYGERRVGLAISDPSETLALPLTTLERRNDRQVIRRIQTVAREEGVTRIVVGEPRRLDGTAGDAAQRVRAFASRLALATGLELILVNEALTSHEAEARLREVGVDPRRHPGRVDQLSAVILLEEVLASRQRQSAP